MDQQDCKCPPPGLPAWMGTFADLMSLLMCFFVLLLSFSEMDVLKFKQIAGSMKYAFGVQNRLEVKDIPKGTSVIAQEFRPGKPDPTPIDQIMQQTVDMTKETLTFQEGNDDAAGGRQQQQDDQRGGSSQALADDVDPAAEAQAEAAQDELNELAKRIAIQLQDEILDGAIEIESLGQQIIIRVREKGSFPSGSAFLQPKIKPVIRKIGALLNDIPGEITVTGHSDDKQIFSELYRSNWDLSSQRAVSVAHEMVSVQGFDTYRLSVVGKANTQPLTKERTREARQRNRRVEISIMQGKAKESPELPLLEQ